MLQEVSQSSSMQTTDTSSATGLVFHDDTIATTIQYTRFRLNVSVHQDDYLKLKVLTIMSFFSVSLFWRM